MALKTKIRDTYSGSFHNKSERPVQSQNPDILSHLFYQKTLQKKPPLHTKSVNEEFYDKSEKIVKKNQQISEISDFSFEKKRISHTKNSSYDFLGKTTQNNDKYDFLKQKTQMILNDLYKIKGKNSEIASKPDNNKENTINMRKFKRKTESENTDKFFENPEKSGENSDIDSKENQSFFSNIRKNSGKSKENPEKWISEKTKEKHNIEVLSHFHEKDLEIIDLKNKLTKNEISMRKNVDSLEKNKAEIEKLHKEKAMKDKEIDYLKVFLSIIQ